MSALEKLFLVLLALAAGTLLGWQASGDRSTPAADSGVGLPTKAPRRDMTPALPPAIQKLLAPVRAARSDDERMRATLALAAAIPVDELEQWHAAGWFGLHQSLESLVFERVTQDRWLAEDPAGLMAYLVRAEHPETSEMAERWAKHDPAGAFAFLRSSPQPDEFEEVARHMTHSLAEKIPQALADEMPWIIETFRESYAAVVIHWMVYFHPEVAAAVVDRLPPRLRRSAITALDRVALEKDFPVALSALVGESDGKARFLSAVDERPGLVEDLFDHAAWLPPGWCAEAVRAQSQHPLTPDPKKWLETDLVAMGLPEEEAGSIRERALWEWAESQPEEALGLLKQGSLPENERRTLLRGCVDALYKQSPQRAEELLKQLSNPDDIALAREGFQEARQEAKAAQVRSIPEWIASYSNDTDQADSSTAALWDARQALEATAAFDALPPEGKGDIARNLVEEVESEIPSELAAAAFRHLLSHPPSGDEMTPEDVEAGISEFANVWSTRDPLAASRWVESLPEGAARLWAAKNLAARWAEYEPAAARRWVSSLPAGDRFEVVDYLDSGAAWKETDE